MFKSTKWRYIALFFIIYCSIFGYYYLVSNGLGNKPFYLQMRRFVVCTVVLLLPFIIIGKYQKFKFFTTHILTALAWFFTFPVLYYMTYSATVPFFSNHFDIVFAIYSFVSLTALHILLLKYTQQINLTSIIISFFQTILLLLPLLEIIYFIYYGSCISEAAIMAIYQTNPEEAKEWLSVTFGYTGLLFISVFISAIFFIFYKLNIKNTIRNTIPTLSKKPLIWLLIMFIGAGFYSIFTVLPQTGLLLAYNNIKFYFDSADKFKEYHINNFKALEVSPPKSQTSSPHTIILVIGESASRNYMSAFSDTEHNTTPWLKDQKSNSNFILYKNAYSSWGGTVPALERALTEKNQYNNKEFNQSITIINIAKKAGYHTSWFSNQGLVDSADTPITLVADTSDTKDWVCLNNTKPQYDGELIEYLKKVDPNKNNFIILHLMGSHDNFQNRYPPEFTQWGDPNVYDFPVNYDNSLYYTDYVLKNIYEYANNNLNLQAMIYFSDHGQNPKNKRHPDNFGFAFLRIPLFVYLSDEYKKINPEIFQTLSNHKDYYFTNDLIYDMVCGILNIKSPNFDETQSLASPKYKFTRETLKTRLGKIPLTDDKTDEK